MYDVGGKLLSGIKSMHVYSLACVRVKGCFMSPWLFIEYMDPVMKEMKMAIRKKGVRFLEEGRESRLPGFFYADDLVLCAESGEDLRAIVGRFVEVCRRRGLKLNAGKSKVMVLNREEGLDVRRARRMVQDRSEWRGFVIGNVYP